MRISDDLMWRYIELLSFQDLKSVRAKKAAVEKGANPRDVKFEFAGEIVARFHGKAAAESAASEFNARFRDGALPDDMPEITLKTPVAGLTVTQLLKQSGLVPSSSEANRVIEQGGVKIDGDRIEERSLTLARGKSYVVQVGKRKAARITLA
jgi:tyrosyl-tRNA synthetase